jgi:2-iminobutanoate/2-iminopropanoate deaminase
MFPWSMLKKRAAAPWQFARRTGLTRFAALMSRSGNVPRAQQRGVPMTKRYIVEVEGVPPSPSPISNAVVVGNQCWISGQLSVGEDGAYAPGTAREEAERAFGNLFRIAEAAGFSRADIVYVDIAFIDLGDVKEVNGLFGELFPAGRRPARTVYQAAKLPFGGRVKVQAVAARE